MPNTEFAPVGLEVPDVSIIIVNWNVRDMLRDCLRSIEQYHGTLDVETIVVDSASTDNSLTMLQTEFPDIKVLAQAENVGFVQGNNIGLEQAGGRYLFLLNPDTVLHPHGLATLIQYMDAHPEVGLAGPHTLNTDGTHQPTRRRFPTPLDGMLDSTWIGQFAPLTHFYMRDTPDDGTFPVDWVQGSALLARREVYQQIGGLDPAYIMFFEELDWCRRAAQAGWHAVYIGNAIITHYGGGSTHQVNTRKHVHFQHSKLRYFRKFHGWPIALLLRAVLIADYGGQILLEGAKYLVGHKRPLRVVRIRTYGVVLRSLLYAGESIVMHA